MTLIVPRHFAAGWLSIICSAALHAEVRLPAVFSDHIVLQGGAPVTVWGWAEAKEVVSVSIAGQTKTTEAGADGKWMLKLDPLKPTGAAETMTVKAKNTLVVNDVLVGEVWLASGQSNMEMQIKGKLHGSIDRADEEIAAAKYPQIRLFVHDAPFAIYELPVPPAEPMPDRPGRWRVCSPETAADFSAIAYFFARDLNQELGMPVGILSAAVGGTPIEAWTSLPVQENEPKLKPVLDDWKKRLTGFEPEQEQAEFLRKKAAWLKVRSDALKKGEVAPKAPLPFKNLGVMNPGRLFNGVIAPLVPYTIRGCIWYQGERNAAGPLSGLYSLQLKTLISDWRTRWGDDFYFAWVQIAPFQKEQKAPSEPKGWGVLVREGMRQALVVPKTGMAIAIDYGGEKAGHPTNKLDFARRLSPLALHDVYGRPVSTWSGPLFKSVERTGNKMRLTFDHAQGLKARDGELQGFAVAGADQKFVWAKAAIEDGRVMVWSDEIREPAAVRYGWAANPKCNLVNAGGFPASPFRTDDWNDAQAIFP